MPPPQHTHPPHPQGCLLTVRTEVNHNFYGHAVTPQQLLLDRAVAPPPAAALLYDALHGLLAKYENRRTLAHAAVARHLPSPRQQQQQDVQ